MRISGFLDIRKGNKKSLEQNDCAILVEGELCDKMTVLESLVYMAVAGAFWFR